MQDLNEKALYTPPDSPVPKNAQPAQASKSSGGGLRITAIVALTVVLAVVFGVGLFSGWVYGSRNTNTGNLAPVTVPTATVSPVTTPGDSLEAMREAAVVKVRPAVVQVNVVTASGSGLGSGVIIDSRGYIVTNNHVISEA